MVIRNGIMINTPKIMPAVTKVFGQNMTTRGMILTLQSNLIRIVRTVLSKYLTNKETINKNINVNKLVYTRTSSNF